MAEPFVQIIHKVNVKADGLKRGNFFLTEELGKAGNRIGKYLQDRVREKQRIDTGQERKRTLYRVKQSRQLPLQVSVYNTVVQGLVDETGATWRGKMPPYRKGSKLFAWVMRKGIARSFDPNERRYIATYHRTEARRAGADKETARQAGRAALKDALNEQDRLAESVTFLVARAISRRGLPRPGDPLRKPFETTRKAERPKIVAMVNAAIFASVKRMNEQGGKDK